MLVKLLPYYDTDLSQRNHQSEESKYLRKLLNISRSEADNLYKRTGIATFHQLLMHFWDKVIVPDADKDLIEELCPNFYG